MRTGRSRLSRSWPCRLSLPGTRLDYWRPKLARNQQRDLENQARLREMGWESIVVWECEIAKDADAVAACLKKFLGRRG